MTESDTSKRGGRRENAGRKTSASPYGEPTQPVRIPISLVPSVKAALSKVTKQPELISIKPCSDSPTPLQLPFYGSKISAGFPSPAGFPF